MATHSSILAWKISWTEELSGATVCGVLKSQTQLSTHTRWRKAVSTAVVWWGLCMVRCGVNSQVSELCCSERSGTRNRLLQNTDVEAWLWSQRMNKEALVCAACHWGQGYSEVSRRWKMTCRLWTLRIVVCSWEICVLHTYTGDSVCYTHTQRILRAAHWWSGRKSTIVLSGDSLKRALGAPELLSDSSPSASPNHPLEPPPPPPRTLFCPELLRPWEMQCWTVSSVCSAR